MAEASISVDQDQFICPVCLDLLRDPVTTPCGHSFCKVCINDCWDQEDQKGVYSCPQCRDTFTPRPVLRRNNMLAEVVEKLKKTEVQAASPAHCYAGPGDVECDFCTERKRKAVKSCLVCLASSCETHLKPHYEVPALKKHKLVEASGNLQEKICSEHDKVLEIYCRTDQSFICYLCMMDEHKSHDTVSLAVETTEKQSVLKEEQMKFQQRIQEKQKKVQELKQAVNSIKSFQSLCVSSGREDSPSITVNQHLSFDGVRKSLSDLKKRLEEFCQEEFNKNPDPDFCDLTLDPNTVNYHLILSEKNRAVTYSDRKQPYSDHPERFDSLWQVLSKESVCGRRYWEVEWSHVGYVEISVSYKDISRKGQGDECAFGRNAESWSLECSSSSLYFCSFWHNNTETELRVPSSSRIGVYVDHSAGTLSFYSVSDTMKLLHRVHTTFTQPLYAGFRLYWNDLYESGLTVRLCDTK
ncbi:hypothetical protein PDJAM_G00192980 [Pangasius djambal]|uniref:Uncharacterized protein n=1 Tax=Pangasius djambal TaxID=1691987 RepID=A0ACC5ZP16_9TELE|nr:hypothetical protein [Pangasius djambal]